MSKKGKEKAGAVIFPASKSEVSGKAIFTGKVYEVKAKLKLENIGCGVIRKTD